MLLLRKYTIISLLCSFPSWLLPRAGRDLPQQLSAEALACVSGLAHLVVRFQEQGSLISPWSLMSCLLLQAPTAALTEEGVQWERLTEGTLWLRGLAKDFGARLNWPGRWISFVSQVHSSSTPKKHDGLDEPSGQSVVSPLKSIKKNTSARSYQDVHWRTV